MLDLKKTFEIDSKQLLKYNYIVRYHESASGAVGVSGRLTLTGCLFTDHLSEKKYPF